MANSKQQDTLLLTEHLTWPPISLLDDIINAVNEMLYNCTEKLEEGLSSADPHTLGFVDRARAERRELEKDEDGKLVCPEMRLEIDEGMLKLETLLEGAMDRNFDRLEIWTLRNVLCLPSEVREWVRLEHYKNLTIPPANPTITPEYLYTLRRKLEETRKLHSALLAEKTRNEALLAKLRTLIQPPTTTAKQEPRSSTSPTKPHHDGPGTNQTDPNFSFLTHTPAAKDLGIQSLPLPSITSTSTNAATTSNPLTTHTSFTASQIPFLRSLLSALKPHLATSALPLTATGEKEESARERKVYIESQSKRVLERRGVDTREGVEGVLEGRGFRGEEVTALEGVVEVLGRGTRGSGDGRERRDGEGGEMDTS
ncbi:Mis12 protein-domain-containing protein [Clohesyomyces aquaticus]|uniref:Mis12 protein-domain-containing protein n=1 Tax=Clohesyomyces aquaticus TaxID=1231657 RepID=A0A1Y1ZU78_9PLEO|nr:Mis12 protein-domain-containing protein [Clohesyomyces aquaticus]